MHTFKCFGMNGQPKLPLLPGFVIHVSLFRKFNKNQIFKCYWSANILQRPKENYHLPQCWLRLNGTNLLVEKKHADNNWLINDSKVNHYNFIPNYLLFEFFTAFKSFSFRQILCFNAFFRQKLAETDKIQIRRVKILFYMEDGTIQVK